MRPPPIAGRDGHDPLLGFAITTYAARYNVTTWVGSVAQR